MLHLVAVFEKQSLSFSLHFFHCTVSGHQVEGGISAKGLFPKQLVLDILRKMGQAR